MGMYTILHGVAPGKPNMPADFLVSCEEILQSRWEATVWLSTGQNKFVESEHPWLTLDQALADTAPTVAGVVNVGLGDWAK